MMETPAPGYVLLAIALVVSFLYISHRTWRRKNWFGIDLNRPVCERCGTPRPRLRFRKPTFREWIFGGWTCPNCGCKLNKNGHKRG